MAFRLGPGENPQDGVRRIAEELTDAGLAALAAAGTDREVGDAVLACRKSCKKLRGLIRLVEPDLGKEFTRADRAYRTAARALAGTRDADILLDTFDRFVADFGDRELRAELRRRLASMGSVEADAAAFADATESLGASRERIGRWKLDGDGFEPLGRGLTTTHNRGIRALQRATRKPTVRRLHDLRTEIKFGWYQLRILRRTSPAYLEPLIAVQDQLGKTLGDAHDVAMLERWLSGQPEAADETAGVDSAIDGLARQRRQLEDASRATAARYYSEPAKRFSSRIGGFWEVTAANGSEPLLPARPHLLDLDELTVAELRGLAAAREIVGRSKLRRAELIECLLAHECGPPRSAGTPGPVPDRADPVTS